MKKNAALIRTLCVPYCSYYKPGRNEEMLCRGAVVVQRLIDSGRSLSIGKKSGRDAGREEEDIVIRHVCSACEFRAQDCDFAQDRRAHPCGGFVLITGLLKSGVITVGDIR